MSEHDEQRNKAQGSSPEADALPVSRAKLQAALEDAPPSTLRQDILRRARAELEAELERGAARGEVSLPKRDMSAARSVVEEDDPPIGRPAAMPETDTRQSWAQGPKSLWRRWVRWLRELGGLWLVPGMAAAAALGLTLFQLRNERATDTLVDAPQGVHERDTWPRDDMPMNPSLEEAEAPDHEGSSGETLSAPPPNSDDSATPPLGPPSAPRRMRQAAEDRPRSGSDASAGAKAAASKRREPPANAAPFSSGARYPASAEASTPSAGAEGDGASAPLGHALGARERSQQVPQASSPSIEAGPHRLSEAEEGLPPSGLGRADVAKAADAHDASAETDDAAPMPWLARERAAESAFRSGAWELAARRYRDLLDDFVSAPSARVRAWRLRAEAAEAAHDRDSGGAL